MPNKNIKSDGELIRCYLDGDTECIKLLIEKWHNTFCKKALWIAKDADLAKDIAQDTWQVVICKMAELKNPDKFEFWALRIVYNKSIDALNKKNKERLNLINYQYESIIEDNPNENIELQTALLVAIKELPYHQQVVLKLFYLEMLSLHQIAKALDIPVGTIKSRLFYSREKLKLILKNRNYEN